jgi:tetratricopeptide (TPR) repeat protein
VRDKFPDGQLYVNLHGYSTVAAADPADVLGGFLRALGVPASRVPADAVAAAALFRDELADRRVLVVCDNAADADQVRPLLPDAPGCLALVTSRQTLPALTAAVPVTLDVLPPADAYALLAEMLGAHRVAAEPAAAAEVARLCAYLPLALRIAAANLNDAETIAAYAARLAAADDRLTALSVAGDERAAVRAAFDLSFAALPTPAQRMFRLLGLAPGPDLSLPAAACLAAADQHQAKLLLDRLVSAHLVDEHAPGRYTLHDLLRAYATQLAHTTDPDHEHRAAQTRLFDFYLATTATAMDVLHPAEAHHRPRIPAPETPIPVLPDPDAARAWLDTERPTLVAVAAHTATHGWPTHTTRLSRILFRYLANGGHHVDALAVHGHARHAAHHTVDPAGQAQALTSLGTTLTKMGRYGPAAEHLQQAMHLFEQAGDQAGRALALGSLGNVEYWLGRYREAAHYDERSLALFRQTGDRTGEARALSSLGIVEQRLGRYGQAVDRLEQALALFRQTGDRSGEADALNNLGYVEDWLGRHGPATEHLQQALVLFRQLGNRVGEAWTLDSLGTLYTRLGQPAQAAEHLHQALAIFRETGDRDGEAYVLNALGEAAHSAGGPSDALTHHTAALTIAVDIGDRHHQQARAHAGLGYAHHTLNHPRQAREHYQQALNLYTDLGVPEADRIRAQLAALDGPSPEQP